MHNSEFEKSVQEKMDALKLAPGDAVWEKVEAALPAERKPRRFLFFLLAAALLLSLFFAWNVYYKNEHPAKNNAASIAAIKNATSISDTGSTMGSAATDVKVITGSASPVHSNAAGSIMENITAGNVISKKTAARRTKIKVKHAAAEEADDAMAIATRKEKNTKTALKVQVKQPAAADEETAVTTVTAEKTLTVAADTSNSKDTAVEVTLSKKDTLQTKTVINQKKSSKKKWIAGVETGAGISYFKTKTASDPLVSGSSVGIPAAPSQGTGSQPSKPSAAFAWGAGVYVQRNLNTQFSFLTGLRYQFLSATMKVGQHIDSSVRAGFNTAVLSANNYYLAGSSVIYKNKFHLLELPLTMQYKPFASSFYFEGGPAISWLLHSNALVCNSSIYVSGNDAYNKLLLSFNAGAGMKLPQKKLSGLETGVRVNYMLSSVIKPVYGAQYPFSVKLFLRIPLKQ